MTEKELQSAVMDLARLLGWKVAHFHDSRRQVRPGVFVGDRDAAGFPDLVLARDRLLFVELKSKDGRVTDKQGEWIEALEDAGAEVRVWWPADWRSGMIERELA